jgi:IS30 family transposase
MGQQRGSLGARVTSSSPWSAGCDESRTSGAEGGPGKRTGSNPDTAPRSDPYVIGKNGATAAVTLVERTSRFTAILALPEGKDSTGVADVLIEHTNELPAMMRKSLTWDQGSEMARHAALTLATDLKVYFADPHSPWQRPSNENTNGLIREYLPKGEVIPAHQPYLTSIAEELNERPRAALGFLTPRESFERLLLGKSPVASTA